MPLETAHWVMLRRNLVYTAVTRGKKLVAVVGSRKALGIAVRTADSAKRFTLLAWRLRHGVDTVGAGTLIAGGSDE